MRCVIDDLSRVVQAFQRPEPTGGCMEKVDCEEAHEGR
jgi:hypothetical protein